MVRKTMMIMAIVVLALTAVGAASANKGKPNFTPQLYADGQEYGTKATTTLPGPRGNNAHSFDKLFAIINSNADGVQLPVAEAAPGNPEYNGGRWATQTVVWTQAGFDAHGTVPVLRSYDEVMLHYNLGHLTITAGSPDPVNGPPDYFQCPLLPVK